MATIHTHRDLRVYQSAMALALDIQAISASFPKDERSSMTDQIRRSSRSVCANIAEAWRKRRYLKSFIAKLSDAETEAAETQVWLEFAQAFGFIDESTRARLDSAYDRVLSQIVVMTEHPEKWSYEHKKIVFPRHPLACSHTHMLTCSPITPD